MCAMPSATFFLTFLRTRTAAGAVAFAISEDPCSVRLLRWWRSRGSGTLNGLARPLAGSRIGARALSACRQSAAMPCAAIAAQIHETLDIHRDFTSKVAFDSELGDLFTQFFHVVIRQILDLDGAVYAGRGANGPRTSPTNAVDRGQRDNCVLMVWNVYTGDTGHMRSCVL